MIYIIFALTTALAAVFTIIKPVLQSLAVSSPENVLVEYKSITYFVFIILAILVAPIMFLPTIIPSLNKTFQESFYNSVKD